MSGLLSYIGLMLGVQLDTTTLLIVNAMSPSPSEVEILALNTAIVDLKSNNYFSGFDRLGVMQGMANAQNRLVDWAKPEKLLTLHGSATCTDVDGVVGSTVGGSYVGTGFNPAVDGANFTTNSASHGFYVKQFNSDGSLGGVYDGSNFTMAEFASGNTWSTRINNSSSGSLTNGASAVYGTNNLFVIQREAADSVKLFLDGVNFSSSTIAATARPNAEMYLTATNLGGVYKQTNVKQAAWWAGRTFSSAEQLAIKQIFTTYFAAVA